MREPRLVPRRMQDRRPAHVAERLARKRLPRRAIPVRRASCLDDVGAGGLLEQHQIRRARRRSHAHSGSTRRRRRGGCCRSAGGRPRGVSPSRLQQRQIGLVEQSAAKLQHDLPGRLNVHGAIARSPSTSHAAAPGRARCPDRPRPSAASARLERKSRSTLKKCSTSCCRRASGRDRSCRGRRRRTARRPSSACRSPRCRAARPSCPAGRPRSIGSAERVVASRVAAECEADDVPALLLLGEAALYIFGCITHDPISVSNAGPSAHTRGGG